MKDGPATPTPAGSKVALTVLVALVVLAPWPFGSVHLRTTQAIALISLTTALGALLWDGWHRQLQLPPRVILWPLLGLWALAVIQLIPLPEDVHRWIAPGSAAVWHPGVPVAAAVLGRGPHPISLYPEATCRWLAFATGLVALALAAAPALRERRYLLRASVAIISGAVLVAIYAFIARLVFADKLFGVWSVPTVAPFGPFVSKNHFAGYVELAALLAVGLATGLADEARHGSGWLSWIESRRAHWVALAWGAAFVLVLAVPVSLSRGGVVSLTAGLASFVLLRLWARRGSSLTTSRLVVALAGLVLGTALVVAVLPSESRDRILSLAGITTEQSGAYRLAIWRDTLRLAASSPAVGSGFGAYEDALPRFKTAAGHLHVQHAENDYLEFLAEGGLLGTLLGGVVALGALFLALKGLRTQSHRLMHAIQTAALAGLATLYVHSGFDFNLRIPSNALMAVLLAALAASAAPQAVVPKGAGRIGGHRPTFLFTVAGSLLLALLTHWGAPAWRPSTLARAISPSQPSLRRADLESDLLAHLGRRPADAPAWLALAWLRSGGTSGDPATLGAWAKDLDPGNLGLREAAERISAN